MKQIFLSTLTDLEEIQTYEPGSWINLVNPSQSESLEVAEHFNIDITDLRAPLDAEESSRIVVEDDYKLIIVDVPILEDRSNKNYYVTIPLADFSAGFSFNGHDIGCEIDVFIEKAAADCIDIGRSFFCFKG